MERWGQSEIEGGGTLSSTPTPPTLLDPNRRNRQCAAYLRPVASPPSPPAALRKHGAERLFFLLVVSSPSHVLLMVTEGLRRRLYVFDGEGRAATALS